MEKQSITEEMGVHKEWMAEAKKQTPETLPTFIKKLTEDYNHDYGTICHAIAAAAIGAANAVNHSPNGGITGFQAGAVMWEMIRGWGVWGEGPKRMTQYEHMLYPQYESDFRKISKSTADWLKTEAKKKLSEDGETAHRNVRDHWVKIAEGWIPFSYTVDQEE